MPVPGLSRPGRPGWLDWLVWLAWTCASLAVAPVHAAALEVLDRLDFGVLALTRNDAVYSISLSRAGNYATSGGWLVVSAGRPGRYRLSGLPAFQPITLELFPGNLARPGNLAPYLDLAGIEILSGSGFSSAADGTLEFRLGARLASDGGGGGYPDSGYLGTTFLRASYQTGSGTESQDFPVEAVVELRGNLTVTQEQGLSFGHFMALSAPGDSASLRLAPNGAIQISQPGAARLVSFGGSRPGAFRVQGGAPNAPVSLTLPASPVEMTLNGSGTGPRLLVDSFVAAPASGLAFDAGGVLDFSLGATLHTEPSPVQYGSGDYTGVFYLTVEYP